MAQSTGTKQLRCAVFISGTGSNLESLIKFSNKKNSPLSIALGVSLAIMIMLSTKTTHPPAGANPVIAILGAKSFEFVIMPVAIGASFIVIFALIYNRIWNR